MTCVISLSSPLGAPGSLFLALSVYQVSMKDHSSRIAKQLQGRRLLPYALRLLQQYNLPTYTTDRWKLEYEACGGRRVDFANFIINTARSHNLIPSNGTGTKSPIKCKRTTEVVSTASASWGIFLKYWSCFGSARDRCPLECTCPKTGALNRNGVSFFQTA